MHRGVDLWHGYSIPVAIHPFVCAMPVKIHRLLPREPHGSSRLVRGCKARHPPPRRCRSVLVISDSFHRRSIDSPEHLRPLLEVAHPVFDADDVADFRRYRILEHAEPNDVDAVLSGFSIESAVSRVAVVDCQHAPKIRRQPFPRHSLPCRSAKLVAVGRQSAEFHQGRESYCLVMFVFLHRLSSKESANKSVERMSSAAIAHLRVWGAEHRLR